MQTPCGEAIEMSTNQFGCKNMVMETVRELSRLDSRELNRDTSGTRAYSLFLVELAERWVVGHAGFLFWITDDAIRERYHWLSDIIL